MGAREGMGSLGSALNEFLPGWDPMGGSEDNMEGSDLLLDIEILWSTLLLLMGAREGMGVELVMGEEPSDVSQGVAP